MSPTTWGALVADEEELIARGALVADEEELIARELRVQTSIGLDALAAARDESIKEKQSPSHDPDLHRTGRACTTEVADYQGDSLPKQVALAPSGPLRFPIISIDASDPNWGEIAETQDHSPFDRPCSQYFKAIRLVYNADPLFDITVLNTRESPLILKAIGIQVLAVCSITYFYGIPQAAKIPKTDSYLLHIPDFIERAEDEPQAVQELIIKKLPDPIYLERSLPLWAPS